MKNLIIIALLCFYFTAKAQPSDPSPDLDSVKVINFPGDPDNGRDPDTIPVFEFDVMKEVKNQFGTFVILYYKEEVVAILKKK